MQSHEDILEKSICQQDETAQADSRRRDTNIGPIDWSYPKHSKAS